jgi:hypothetical protein
MTPRLSRLLDPASPVARPLTLVHRGEHLDLVASNAIDQRERKAVEKHFPQILAVR